MIDGPYHFVTRDHFLEVYCVDSHHDIEVLSSSFLTGSGQWVWKLLVGDAQEISELSKFSTSQNFSAHSISLYFGAVLANYRIREDGSIPRIIIYTCT